MKPKTTQKKLQNFVEGFFIKWSRKDTRTWPSTLLHTVFCAFSSLIG